MGTTFGNRIPLDPAFGQTLTPEPEKSIWPYAVKVIAGALILGAAIGFFAGHAHAGQWDNSKELTRYEQCWMKFTKKALRSKISFNAAVGMAPVACEHDRNRALMKDGDLVVAMESTFEAVLCRSNPDRCQ